MTSYQDITKTKEPIFKPTITANNMKYLMAKPSYTISNAKNTPSKANFSSKIKTDVNQQYYITTLK